MLSSPRRINHDAEDLFELKISDPTVIAVFRLAIAEVVQAPEAAQRDWPDTYEARRHPA